MIIEQSGKLFFHRSSEGILRKMITKTAADYPNIKINSYFPLKIQDFSVRKQSKKRIKSIISLKGG